MRRTLYNQQELSEMRNHTRETGTFLLNVTAC